MNREFLEEIKQVLSEEQIWEDERMSRHTTFRVGGKADIFLQPHCEQIAGVIRLCKSYDVPYTVIGNGSNLLVSDAGVRGAVIELGRTYRNGICSRNTGYDRRSSIYECGSVWR